jgi:hypothetical protein
MLEIFYMSMCYLPVYICLWLCYLFVSLPNCLLSCSLFIVIYKATFHRINSLLRASYTKSKFYKVLIQGYKISKFIEFTNTWKHSICLFASSKLDMGQFPPAFLILFLRDSICFRNFSHSHIRWSVVCGPVLHTHTGSFMILNLW